MRFGFCTEIKNYDHLVDLGYDYIELSGSSIYKMTENQFKNAKNTINNGPIRCESINSFILPEVKILGELVNFCMLEEYVDKVVSRAASFGADKICFGSPSSRMIPKGYSREKAKQDAIKFVNMTLKKAEQYGLNILIEALGTYETNFLNTTLEALEFLGQLNGKNTGLVLDLYHFWRGKEDINIINSSNIKYIKHVHIAEEEGRIALIAKKIDKYKKYVYKLKDAGYDESISFEGIIKDFSFDAKKTLEILKTIDAGYDII